MLKDLINGKESSSCVLIEDTVEQNGRGLLKAFICSLSNRFDTLHIVLTELTSDRFLKGLPTGVQQKVIVHDLVTDPHGWEPQQNCLSLDSDLCKAILSSHCGKKFAVVIDNLSTLVLHKSTTFACQLLHRLSYPVVDGQEVNQLISLIHRDLHDDLTLNLLQYCASTIMTLTPARRPPYHTMCCTEHKKLSGKVFKTKEHFSLEKDFSVSAAEEYIAIGPAITTEYDTVDPAANLTFNLTLTDKEKEARSQVPLPYMLDQQKKESVLQKSVGQGKIFYQPDEVDDFDEDDPDDDLDF